MGLADHLREARLTPEINQHPLVVAARDALRQARAEVTAAEQEMADAGDDQQRYREASKKARTAEKNVTLADKAYRAAKKKASNEPREKAIASAAMRKGTCQVCGRAFDLVGKVLPRHGWKEVGGIKGAYRGAHIGRCYGERQLPLQVSCDTAKELLGKLRQGLNTLTTPEDIKRQQAFIRTLETTISGWKPDKTWKKLVRW